MKFKMAKLLYQYHLYKIFQRNQTYPLNQVRTNNTFASENIVELGDKTLTGRLLMYLSNLQNFEKSDCTHKVNNNTIKSIDLKQCDTEQIKSFVRLLDVDQVTENFNLFKKMDRECYDRVHYLKTQDILEILHIYMRKVPNRIVTYQFYESALKELSRRLRDLDKNDTVQLIFYLGLKKRMSREHELLRKCINKLLTYYAHTLKIEDLCIVCNSLFKTTTRLKTDQFYSEVVTNVYNNLYLFKDPALLVTFLKTIRQNRHQDDEFLATMTSTIFFNKTLNYYSFSALGHILAVYSDYLYYDENILRVFTERCVYLLEETTFISIKEHTSSHIRLKDIKRFLWCLSNLNYKLNADVVKAVIIPNIIKRVEAGDVEMNYSSLVEISLYLWMLNYRPYELFTYFLTKENIKLINAENTPVKQKLNALLTCIFYEDKELFENLGVQSTALEYNMEIQLQKRPFLTTVTTSLNNNNQIAINTEIEQFKMSCQIPGIHIIGITGHKNDFKTGVHIEVLDEYTTLKNTENMPTGLMQLKLRLLEQMDEALIVLEAEELKNLNDQEIKQLLEEEIDFVC